MAEDTNTDFAALYETLILPEGAGENVAETLTAAPGDWRDTLRSSLPLLPLGTSRDSQFQIASVLGEGGMGIVHLAHQPALGRDVAIKTVSHDRATRETENALLLEARVMGMVEHPNVVPVHVIGQDDSGRPVIVMKRIDGTTWAEFLDGEVPVEAEDTEGFHLSIVLAVCRALSFAHDRQLLHRDVKPENVMIGRFGEVYLVDWGLAVSLDPDSRYVPYVGQTDSLVGTPVYMAPEMTAADGRLIGIHTDVFLVGAVLYHAVTGDPPNRGKSLFDVLAFSYEGRRRSYSDSVPTELQEICEKAMAHKPADRFGSVEALREALEAYLAHRNSHELVGTARGRLKRLEELIAKDADGIQQLFGEARFGFISAAQIWPDNPDATSGLQECLLTMIEYELDQQNVQVARNLLRQLPEPDAELETRVRLLEEELGAEAARLEKLAFDYDEDFGVGARRWIVGVMAAMFAITPLVGRLFQQATVPESLHWLSDDPLVFGANLFGLAFLPILGGFALYTRPRFAHHKASRIFMRGLLLMYVLGFGARTASLWGGAPLGAAAAAETLVFSSGLMMLGLSVDRRLFLSGVVYGLAAPALFLFNDIAIDIYSAASVLACLAFIYFDTFLRREP